MRRESFGRDRGNIFIKVGAATGSGSVGTQQVMVGTGIPIRVRKLDIGTDNWMIEHGFRLDHAGKQIAFVAAAGQPGLEIRALENFLPMPAAAAQRGKK